MTTSDDREPFVRLLVVLVVVLLLFPILLMLFAFPMMGGRYGAGYPLPLWGWLVVFVPFGLVIALGYLVYRTLGDGGVGSDPALEELRIAYARGDISEEEFDTRRERLRDEN